MSAILNSINIHNFPIFQPILMKLVPKLMAYRAHSYKIRTLIIRVAVPFKKCHMYRICFVENVTIYICNL